MYRGIGGTAREPLLAEVEAGPDGLVALPPQSWSDADSRIVIGA